MEVYRNYEMTGVLINMQNAIVEPVILTGSYVSFNITMLNAHQNNHTRNKKYTLSLRKYLEGILPICLKTSKMSCDKTSIEKVSSIF